MDYHLLVCDDDQLQAKNIATLLKMSSIILEEDDIHPNVDLIATDAASILDYLESNPDLTNIVAFLDIQLDKNKQSQAGLALAQQIQKKHRNAQIIFITTHEELAFLTFQRRINPLDYIVKTTNQRKLQRRLTETLELAIRHLNQFEYIQTHTFKYKIGTRIINVNFNNILYITTTKFPHKLKIVTINGQGEFSGNIKDVEQNYSFFFKASQSALINPQNIESINTKSRIVTFINGDKIKFSRSRTKELNKIYKEKL
ncbi:LytR/AlgR family response regulator transcription factor [Limosilactobacillus reuteri]|uniref:Two component transcriptional regulator, LytTR family n=2 Tax=Limosilactobacillus reuteri TaxID=1598 RepID=B3XMM1_LIMR1|nr:LytTR family DNA-binding domain-containing protein [Limosilactobacillus reuteri]EDX43289.1 two component transcriptional regulator, LytTR family [Limosilactobacillus reuteri subsp. rodentium]MCC4476052.1 LytTR family DNA-binding domain-containing protein [Limosilactobacillus reuteri]